MKNKNFAIMMGLLLFGAALFFSCQKESLSPTQSASKKRTITGFEVPTLGIPSPPVLITAQQENFVCEIGNKIFNRSYTVSNKDIMTLKNSTNCATIAIYNGLINPGNYAQSNRVCIVVPVNQSYQTITGTAMLNGNIITQAVAALYINNYKNFVNRDEVRGVLLDKSQFKSAVISGNGIRVSHVINPQSDRGISTCLVPYTFASGMSFSGTPTYQPQGELSVDDSRVCPNNCDIY